MMGQGSEAMQVVYMEVEGIKLAYQLSKEGIRLLWQLGKFLLCALKDAPYKKVRGRTNVKNFLMRSNGQSVMPVTLDKKSYEEFKKLAKKYGLLFHSFDPLKSGKKGAVEILILEKDMAILEKIMSKVKERQIREDVKNGMTEEQAQKKFDENNHVETMNEFAENTGATTEEEVFEAEMKERFGEDYEEKIIDFEKTKGKRGNGSPKAETAGMDDAKVNNLADIIHFQERTKKLKEKGDVKIQFVYDPENGKSQIIDETETHIRIAGQKKESNREFGWESVWIPKEAIDPPLGKDGKTGGIYTAYLPEGEELLVEEMTGGKRTRTRKAEELAGKEGWNVGSFVAEGTQYETALSKKEQRELNITIGRTYLGKQDVEKKGINVLPMIWEETDTAIKTRVPGTYGGNMRFLWIDKEKLRNAYNGKSYLTSLEEDKDYKLYTKDDRVAETIKGSELYKQHYDHVNEKVKQNAEMQKLDNLMIKGRGRRI